MQPGTAQEGKSWQSRSPDPDSVDDKLQQALKDSFPASDPAQPAQPGVTGWDAPIRYEELSKKGAGDQARRDAHGGQDPCRFPELAGNYPGRFGH